MQPKFVRMYLFLMEARFLCISLKPLAVSKVNFIVTNQHLFCYVFKVAVQMAILYANQQSANSDREVFPWAIHLSKRSNYGCLSFQSQYLQSHCGVICETDSWNLDILPPSWHDSSLMIFYSSSCESWFFTNYERSALLKQMQTTVSNK